MIVAKLKFFHVKSEMFFRNTMIFQHSFFSKTPESFKTVNVDSAIGKFLSMVKAEMPTVDKERFIASKLIRIKYASFFSISSGCLKNLSQSQIFRKRGKYSSFSLQHAQNQSFSRSSSASIPFSSASKVGIINFNFSGELTKLFLSSFGYLSSKSLIDSVNCFVIKVQNFAGLIGWYLKSKVFNYLFNSFCFLKRISFLTSWAVNSAQRICADTTVMAEYTFPTVHSTIYLNRFSVECT